jgi:hypothetical protein
VEPDLGDGDFFGEGFLAYCFGLDWFCFLRQAFSLRSFWTSVSAKLEEGGKDFLAVTTGGVFLDFTIFSLILLRLCWAKTYPCFAASVNHFAATL